MMKKSERSVISGEGISYYVTYDVDSDGPEYGIRAELDDDKSDAMSIRKIFFTEEEAAMRCKWLCGNQVYPVALLDTLRNII